MTPAWSGFFEAAGSAAAGLAGLIFVALSVNIARILEFTPLPARAAAAIGALMLILTTSLAALVPQPAAWLGGETLALAAVAWLLQVNSSRLASSANRTYGRPHHEFLFELVSGQLQLAPFVVGGAALMLSHPAGVYGLALGAVLVFMLAVMNAWVLLVEILR